MLAGDESMDTARALEAALLDQYPGNERLYDLLKALSLCAPGSGRLSLRAEGTAGSADQRG